MLHLEAKKLFWGYISSEIIKAISGILAPIYFGKNRNDLRRIKKKVKRGDSSPSMLPCWGHIWTTVSCSELHSTRKMYTVALLPAFVIEVCMVRHVVH